MIQNKLYTLKRQNASVNDLFSNTRVQKTLSFFERAYFTAASEECYMCRFYTLNDMIVAVLKAKME